MSSDNGTTLLEELVEMYEDECVVILEPRLFMWLSDSKHSFVSKCCLTAVCGEHSRLTAGQWVIIILNGIISSVPLRPYAHEWAGDCRHMDPQNGLASPRIYPHARLHVLGVTVVRSIIHQYLVSSECIS